MRQRHDDGYVTYTWTLGQDETGVGTTFPGAADKKTVQATGTFSGGSVTLEGSMDGTNWFSLTSDGSSAISFSAAGGALIYENPRFFRPVASDTASLSVEVIIGGPVNY